MQMKRTAWLLVPGVLLLCGSNGVCSSAGIAAEKQDDYRNSCLYIRDQLPAWLLKTGILDGIEIRGRYRVDNRMDTLYLEEDFNGDDFSDLIIPILETETGKAGFAIVHGKTNQLFIIGAGTEIKQGLSDNMNYVDIWRVNRDEICEPGLNENGEVDRRGALFLSNPSIQIETELIGGGQIYWNGKEYAYFHQTY
jgi:hypothetical protein